MADEKKLNITKLTVKLVYALRVAHVLVCGFAATRALIAARPCETMLYESQDNSLHKFFQVENQGMIVKIVFSYSHLCRSFLPFAANIMVRALKELVFQLKHVQMPAEERNVVVRLMSGRTGEPQNMQESVRLMGLRFTRKQQWEIWLSFLNRHVPTMEVADVADATQSSYFAYKLNGVFFQITDDALAKWYSYLGGKSC